MNNQYLAVARPQAFYKQCRLIENKPLWVYHIDNESGMHMPLRQWIINLLPL